MTQRWCFYVDETMNDGNGFIPCVVTEHERGYAPLSGRGRCSAPWYWGSTIEEAKRICADENARLGLSPLDAIQIVASSMVRA